MSIERDEIKEIILSKLHQAGYVVKINHFIRNQFRDTIIPICILADDGSPCLAIRIRIRKEGSQKYSKKPSQRLHNWEQITGGPVITIWNRNDAEKITRTINKLFS